MATIVRSWSSAITHITDTDIPNADHVVTRCGRQLKNFHLHYSGETECPRCGGEDDFNQVYEERHQVRLEEKRRREAAHREQETRKARRLETHRELMGNFEVMLKEMGAEVVEHRQQVAGGSIEFQIGGLKFKLTGNIW